MLTHTRLARHISLLLAMALLVGFFGPLPAAHAASLVVTTSADSGPGSLRQAIADANASPGLDTISFNIAGAGVHMIEPTTPLPAITDPVRIDGTTQPGASCSAWPPTLLIGLTGVGLSAGGPGLDFDGSGGSIVRGLIIESFTWAELGSGIRLTNTGGNAIECNFIGTDPGGTTIPGPGDLDNLIGILIRGASSNNRVGTNGDGVADAAERNLLSGNRDAIVIDGATGNVVAGNYIGTDVTGSAPLGNSGTNIFVLGSNNRIGTNGDGVADAAERNIIADSASQGVFIYTGSSGNVVAGNYIGTDVTGTRALGNNAGVFVYADNNIIGTDGSNDAFNAGEGNLISGNVQAGVWVAGGSSNVVAGNTIGTNVAGTAKLPNDLGVFINAEAVNTRVGTNADGVADTAERNVIAGSTNDGIQSTDNTRGTVVQGNYVGTDRSGTLNLGNGNVGVNIANGTDAVIGGTSPAARNLISGNKFGVVSGSTGTQIVGNYIGTNAAGDAAIPNQQDAIQVNADDVIVKNNLIAGNGTGLTVGGQRAQIQGNLIGVDASGTRALSTGDGISLFGPGALVGGSSPAERNVISGNTGSGILLYSQDGGTRVYGNYIGTDVSGTRPLGNQGNGIQIQGTSYTIGGVNPGEGNTIAYNSGAGVLVGGGGDNSIRGNSIDANGNRGIISPGVPFPFITRAVPSGGSLRATGVLAGTASTAYTLDFYASPACDASFFGEGRTYLGSQNVSTDANGTAAFDLSFAPSATVPFGQFVTATLTGPSGTTSAFSNCSSAGPGNDVWPRAYALRSGATFAQPLDLPGQSRWFSLPVPPGARIAVTLSGAGGGALPAAYDLAVFKDIGQAFTNSTSPQDLTRLSAEFAGSGFNNDTLAPDALDPVRIAPEAYSPQAYSPQAYSPQAYSPQAYSPQAYSPQAYSPQAYSPQAYSPQAYSPQAYSPQAYSPQAYSPEQQAYASAQSRSLIGVAAQEGTAARSITLNTWNNSGNFYIQVRGRNGAFTPLAPFQIQATVLDGVCAGVNIIGAVDAGISGSYRTVILADLRRVAGSPAEIDALRTKLQALAARENGIIIDTGDASYANVQTARAEVNGNTGCPFAKTQLAEKIKALYRNVSGLEYIVIVGNDDAVPFFRSPDNAPLGPESNYDPPVLETSAAQASLRLNYILGQDAYGARTTIAYGSDILPLPEIPVGRLVENAAEINTVLDAYLNLQGGVVPTPSSALITSYDFLVDAGATVQSELTAGLTSSARPSPLIDTLVSPASQSFLDPNAWKAADLRAKLFGSRHDLIFLAGHFSAASALAADFRSSINAVEVVTATTNFTNAIVWSVGCHSGYNLVSSADVPGVTREPDWAQAFASRGATLIAGTGYQYGDTDFLAYSEQIYTEFSRQLRVGSGPVAIGDALVAAKQAYLAKTPQLQGIDDKALRIAAIYGLPMLKVDMPGARLPAPTPAGTPITPVLAADGPGSNPQISLRSADLLNISTGVTLQPSVVMKNIDDGSPVSATYYRGPDGLVIRPVEPVLPLKGVNVGASNTVLRGVGFRGGNYRDEANARPLVSAPTYDLRGVKVNFAPQVFWPLNPWGVNYFDALSDLASGTTRLLLTPVQYRANAPTDQTGTRRVFSGMDFRLFYSSFTTTFPSGSAPALSGGPSIARVTSAITGTTGADIIFSASVTGDPAAGVQGVWVTWTDPTAANPRWQSLDLTQSAGDSTLWTGRLNGVSPANVDYIVQAVSALGVVTMADNFGAYFRPGVDPAAPPSPAQQPAALAFVSAPPSGAYSTRATFTAKLTSGGTSQAGQTLIFTLAGQSQPGVTGSDGRASATFTLTGRPGVYQAGVSFGGTPVLAPTAASGAFTITKRDTTLTLAPASASVPAGADTGIVATLTDAGGAPLALRTVFFIVGGQNIAAQTDALGQARLGALSLPVGSYSVRAAFGGSPVAGVTQSDPNYNPSSASASLTLTGGFPATGILDNFNRTSGGVGGSWEGATGSSFYGVQNNQLDVQRGGPLVWKPASFGPSQEAYVTLSAIDPRGASQGVLLKVQTGSIPSSGAIAVVYDAVAKAVRISTIRAGNKTWKTYAVSTATFASGDRLGARALPNGSVQIFKNGALVTTVTLSAADQSFFNAKGGKIGVWAVQASNTFLDDFGGGTITP